MVGTKPILALRERPFKTSTAIMMSLRFGLLRYITPLRLRLFACLLAVAALCGCARNKNVLEFDPRFSMNLIKPPAEFPPKKAKLTPAESEALARLGKPDFIRVWWRPDGTPITSSDLSGKRDQIPQMLSTNKKSWIYMSGGEEGEPIEVLFRGNGAGYTKRPVGETLKLICQYGDPSSKSVPVVRRGETYETWQWIEYGLQVELCEGHEVGRSRFAATGTGTYLGK